MELHARASPGGGLTIGRAAQRGQRRLEDLVLLEPERVDGAEVLGLGLLDLIGEQDLRLVRRPLVEARVAVPEMGSQGTARIDDRARQGGGRRQEVADRRALQVIRVRWRKIMLQGCRNGGPRSETRNGLNGHNGTYRRVRPGQRMARPSGPKCAACWT